jgi:Ni2+-binding GTPase involved in maturation of urease and hydrogenase
MESSETLPSTCLVTVAGPPTSGKTSVLRHALRHLVAAGRSVGVAKFDCLVTSDAQAFRDDGLEAIQGLSGSLCPDHFFAGNLPDVLDWAQRRRFEILVTESAGLCNRCAPHVRGQLAVCVLDHLGGIGLPAKVGPMLRRADLVVVTRGDLVSQAEREVFAVRVKQAAPSARVVPVNGLTGQGAAEFALLLDRMRTPAGPLEDARLRFSMPAAVCSYCLGETNLARDRQIGNLKRMEIPA